MHVGNYAGKYKERTSDRKDHPAMLRLFQKSSPTSMSRDKREAESVGAVETPVGAHDAHLVGQEVPSQTCQNKSEQEVPRLPGVPPTSLQERSSTPAAYQNRRARCRGINKSPRV